VPKRVDGVQGVSFHDWRTFANDDDDGLEEDRFRRIAPKIGSPLIGTVKRSPPDRVVVQPGNIPFKEKKKCTSTVMILEKKAIKE